MAFVIAALVCGGATPGHAEDCSFYRGVLTSRSVSGTTVTVNWQSQTSNGFPASCIGWMMLHEPETSDWYGNPHETTPASTHVSTVTVPKGNTVYEYVVFADFDGDGDGCIVLSGLITTGDAPPPCSNYVLSRSSSTTSTSFTISFSLRDAASTRLAYRRNTYPPSSWSYTAATVSQYSHEITVSNLSSGTEYTYNVEEWCASTNTWDFLAYGTVTTGSSSGGGPKEHIKQLAMTKVWPIPAAGSTHLRFALPREMAVRVDIFDVQGRMVRNVVSGTYPAGEFETEWDGRTTRGASAPSGVYFARVQAGQQSSVRRFMIASK